MARNSGSSANIAEATWREGGGSGARRAGEGGSGGGGVAAGPGRGGGGGGGGAAAESQPRPARTWMYRGLACCHLRMTNQAQSEMTKVSIVATIRPQCAATRSTAGTTSVAVSCCGMNISRSRPGAIMSSTISACTLRDLRASGNAEASALASAMSRRSWALLYFFPPPSPSSPSSPGRLGVSGFLSLTPWSSSSSTLTGAGGSSLLQSVPGPSLPKFGL